MKYLHYILGPLIGLGIGFGSNVLWNNLNKYSYDDFLVVGDVFVPNHRITEDPTINVTRTVVRNFRGEWFVEFQKVKDGRFQNICTTKRHRNDYSTNEDLPDKITLHDWWTYNDCVDKVKKSGPGKYRILTVWTPLLPNNQTAPSIRKPSNTYEVTK